MLILFLLCQILFVSYIFKSIIRSLFLSKSHFHTRPNQILCIGKSPCGHQQPRILLLSLDYPRCDAFTSLLHCLPVCDYPLMRWQVLSPLPKASFLELFILEQHYSLQYFHLASSSLYSSAVCLYFPPICECSCVSAQKLPKVGEASRLRDSGASILFFTSMRYNSDIVRPFQSSSDHSGYSILQTVLIFHTLTATASLLNNYSTWLS